jgi:RND superfamily putative drug exporter
MERWTRFVIRNRKKVLVAWVAALVLAGYASSGLADLLTNRFSVPGSDAEKGLDLLKEEFGERGDGGFTLVVQPRGGGASDPALLRATQAAAERGAAEVRGGKAGVVRPADDRIVYVPINSVLENADASTRTDEMRKAIGDIPGARSYLTGAPAINHDTEPLYEEDLVRGEMVALPIALLVLAFMLGTLGAIAVPFAFAFVSIPVTLGFVWVFANFIDMATYVQNIVTLIGLAIAIDYSMLVVFRFREELAAGGSSHDALARTMDTAGRATLFSGLTVALGLALLILMPVPFMQSMGIGGVLVPLVSIAAAATFLPALLAVMGSGVNRFRVVPKRVLEKRVTATGGLWGRLAHSIMRRPVPYLLCGGLVMLALAYPATGLDLTGGDNRGVPKTTEATRGLALLENSLGAGALSPNQVLIDTGRRDGAWSGRSVDAQRALAASLRSDEQIDPQAVVSAGDFVSGSGKPAPEVVAAARKANLVSADGRYVQVRAAGIQDSGSQASMDLVERIRESYVPDAGFGAVEVLVTGAPAFGVDFIDTAYSAFPWLVVGVLILSYLLLLRAFRSLFLPLKAVFMNLLSVSATYGVLVLAFQHGWGGEFGLGESPQIEAWIPIFLFAMLFGLSMDYEVFLLSRMREEWDRFRDNEKAVALGLEHTGRIITAAALIMIAAFSGFTAGSFVGLQMFGLGLSVAILLDATIVRALLVPAVMKLMGRWNWYLPPTVARVMRVREPEAVPVIQPALPAFVTGNGHPPALPSERTAEPAVHRLEESR